MTVQVELRAPVMTNGERLRVRCVFVDTGDPVMADKILESGQGHLVHLWPQIRLECEALEPATPVATISLEGARLVPKDDEVLA